MNQLNEQLDRSKQLMGLIIEAYGGGIIKEGDVPCDIWCKIKVAMKGSRGDVVKMIQHLLARGCGDQYGPYNPEKMGGGMNEGCAENWTNCDGKFEKETKKAVEEFQGDFSGLKVDGKVGYNTISVLCKYCNYEGAPTGFNLCHDCKDCEKQQQNIQIDDIGGDDILDVVDDGDDWFIDIDIPAEYGKDCDKIKACLQYVSSLQQTTKSKWSEFINCMNAGTNKPDWFNSSCMKWIPYDWEKGGLVICISGQGNSYGPYYDEGGGVLVFPDGDPIYYENLEISETRAKELGIKGGGDIAVAASECCTKRRWKA